jgi:hypothetical protein
MKRLSLYDIYPEALQTLPVQQPLITPPPFSPQSSAPDKISTNASPFLKFVVGTLIIAGIVVLFYQVNNWYVANKEEKGNNI